MGWGNQNNIVYHILSFSLSCKKVLYNSENLVDTSPHVFGVSREGRHEQYRVYLMLIPRTTLKPQQDSNLQYTYLFHHKLCSFPY